MDIGAKLKDARVTAGLTQQELAKIIGESQQNVDKFEHGQRIPNLATAARIAAATGATLDEFVKEDTP